MTPRRSFLLLVIGLDILSWVFPVFTWIAAIFGFVTIWAVMGFRWGLAVAMFASIPGWIQSSFFLYQTLSPMAPKFSEAVHACQSIINSTLQQACFRQQLNFTALPNQGNGIVSSLPKPPSLTWLPHVPNWLLLVAVIPLECLLIYRTIIRRVLRIKNRIRQSIGHVYGFRNLPSRHIQSQDHKESKEDPAPNKG